VKGSDEINIVDYRMADAATIRYFNQIIYRCKKNTVIGIEKYLYPIC